MTHQPARTGALIAAAAVAVLAATPIVASAKASPDPRRIDRAWAAPALDEPRSMAADTEGVVVVGRGGMMLALGTAGREQWRADLGRGAFSEAITLGGELVVASNRARLVALNRRSGAWRWEHPSTEVRASAIGDGFVATIAATGGLELLDATSGATRWSGDVGVVGDLVKARVWLVAGRVVAAWADDVGSHLRGVDQASGAPVWADDAPHFASMPAVRNGESVVFAANERRDQRKRVVARVRSLSVIDGVERWSREIRGRWGYWAAVDTAESGWNVAVVDLDGRVTMFDGRTGTVRWRRATHRRQYEASPKILGGAFVLTTYGTGLTALGVTRGSVVDNDEPGVVQTLVTIEASAAVGDRLYLLIRYRRGDGGVWMLHPEAG